MKTVDHPPFVLNPGDMTPADVAKMRAWVETARRHADLLSLNAEHLFDIASFLARLARGQADVSQAPVSVCTEFASAHAQQVRRSTFGLAQALRALDDRLAGRTTGAVVPESFAAEGR